MLTGDLPPGDVEPALVIGYFNQTFGTPYKIYQGTDVFEGSYRGNILKIPAPPAWQFKLPQGVISAARRLWTLWTKRRMTGQWIWRGLNKPRESSACTREKSA